MAKVNKKKQETEIDKLARVTAAGFARMDDMHSLFIDRFDRLEADMADVKRTLGPLVQMMALTDKKVDDLEFRLKQVERKVGIKK